MIEEHRCCQQDTVYAAEAELKGVHEFAFEDIAEVQRFLDGLREQRWWPILIGRVEAYKRRGGGRSVGWYEPAKHAGGMELATLKMTTVLHELAHVLAEALHGSHAHDPWYCREMLQLVYRVLGSDAYVLLRSAYEQHGVIHDPEAL